jgi:opacity protein-like surface antigen
VSAADHRPLQLRGPLRRRDDDRRPPRLGDADRLLQELPALRHRRLCIIQWGDGRNTGWYIGGGVDWALAQNWTIGIEYRHYDFDTNLELARAVVGGVWGAVPNDNATFDMSADTITLRVNWKLGRPEPRPLK